MLKTQKGNILLITYHIMTEEEKETVSRWNYEGEYSIYNMPSYAEQKEQSIGFGNPSRKKNFYSYWENDILIGFTNILEEDHEVFIGLGVSPFLCGQGYGQKVLMEAQKISKRLYPDKPLYLEVRSWNHRAIRCYQKAGFLIQGEEFEQKTLAGSGRFFRMIYPKSL